jgi:hypothetical protein
LLALRPRSLVFIADSGTGFKGSGSALQGITEKGRINLAKAQSHFNIKFQICTFKSSTFPRSRRKICWGNKGSNSLGSERTYIGG